MVYDAPAVDAPIDQGDIIMECPIVEFTATNALPQGVKAGKARVIVITQTCDFAQGKVSRAVVALAIDAAEVVAAGLLKRADVVGPVRAGRVVGWYFLPADHPKGIPELIVDFRQIHTVSLAILESLCRSGQRQGLVRPLYREHLATPFADTYSRIGLPEPYPSA